MSADPLVTAVSQSLYGPTRKREMEKTIVMEADREHAFAGFVDGMYKQALAEKQQRMEARKAREAQKALSEAEINPEQEK